MDNQKWEPAFPDKYEHQRKGRSHRREYVQALKERGQCVDCGQADPRALTFVHSRGVKIESGGIGTLTSRAVGWPRLKAAIAASDLVCLNCSERRSGDQQLHEKEGEMK